MKVVAVIHVVVETSLDGVARKEKILLEQIGDKDILVAIAEGVQTAVGVLLQHGESGNVVLVAVGAEISKDANARLLIVKDKAAKVAVEALDPQAHGHKIIFVAEILQLHFHEALLQAGVVVKAGGAIGGIGINDADFFYR